MDTTHLDTWKAHALAVATRNYAARTDPLMSPRDAAREALAEAHSSLSQPAFFTAVDALGGHAAVVRWLAAQIETNPHPEGIQP